MVRGLGKKGWVALSSINRLVQVHARREREVCFDAERLIRTKTAFTEPQGVRLVCRVTDVVL